MIQNDFRVFAAIVTEWRLTMMLTVHTLELACDIVRRELSVQGPRRLSNLIQSCGLSRSRLPFQSSMVADNR
jgi:hypothetical protein